MLRTTHAGPVQISAVKFKATCLKLIDRVAQTGEPVVITKRGKVLARLVPDRAKQRGFGKGRDTVEILCSDEDLFRLGAGERRGKSRWGYAAGASGLPAMCSSGSRTRSTRSLAPSHRSSPRSPSMR